MDLGTIGIIIFGAIAGVALIFLLISLSPPPLELLHNLLLTMV